jgi:putative endonuclease
MTSYTIGIQAESLAIDFFQNNGYSILHKRYRSPYGEVDLITTKNKELIFVEVKRRRSISDGAYSISKRQKERIMRAYLWFIQENPHYQNTSTRFDAIIYSPHQPPQHIQNAFWSEENEIF